MSHVRVFNDINDHVDIFTNWPEFLTENTERHVESDIELDEVLVYTEVSNTESVSWLARETIFRFVDTSETILITFSTVAWILFVFLYHIMSWVTDIAELFWSTSETVISTFETFGILRDIIISRTLSTILRCVHITRDTIGFGGCALETCEVLSEVIFFGAYLTSGNDISWCVDSSIVCCGIVCCSVVCCGIISGGIISSIGSTISVSSSFVVGSAITISSRIGLLCRVVTSEILHALAIDYLISCITLFTEICILWTVITVVVCTPFLTYALYQIISWNTLCALLCACACLTYLWAVYTLVVSASVCAL